MTPPSHNSQDIQARLKRLRKAGKLRRAKTTRKNGPEPTGIPQPQPPEDTISPDESSSSGVGCLTELPGMTEVHSAQGNYLLRTVRFPLTHRQGRISLGELLALPEASLIELAATEAFDIQRAVFLDTETSGLAGGAGTIVFLTGVGVFEEDVYVVHQYFARNPAEESAYLPDLAHFIAMRGGLITFNGRSFDWPLLRSRFILNGIAPPNEQPHVDLLHPARRLWRSRLGSCNFGNLEHHILSYHRSGLDIPSWQIPNLWFNFARGQGSIRAMEAVLYHNLEDIVSMAPLAHVIAATLSGAMEPHPKDWLALARAQQRSGQRARAEASYRRAQDSPMTPSQRVQAMRELALLLKHTDRREEAATWWRALAEMDQTEDVEALVELAKYHEWHSGDLAQAVMWTQEAIRRVQTWPDRQWREQTLAQLEHRLQRLQKKLR